MPRVLRRALVIAALTSLIAVSPTFASAGPSTDVLGSVPTAEEPGRFVPSGWRSSLYPEGWTPGSRDRAGRMLADFSYAGYRYGSALPHPTERVVDVTKWPFRVNNRGTKDATKALQRAIDYVGRTGGGVVYLPPGTYRVAPQADRAQALTIGYDDVVVRGAGRDRTLVYNTTPAMRNRAVIALRPPDTPNWGKCPAGAANLAADSLAGSMRVRVTNAGSFSAGDLVVIRTEATPAWLALYGNPPGWSPSFMDATTHLRRVTSVEAEGWLALDIPLRTDVLMRDRGSAPNVYKASDHLEGSGLEDLSIGMAEEKNPSLVAYNTHLAKAVLIRNANDCWVQRVGTFAPPGNRADVHLLSEGIWLEYARSVTVRDCLMRFPQFVGAGDGYLFAVRGSDNLFERCASVRARHAFTAQYWYTTGNVITDSASARPTLATDFHAWLAAANLLERMRLDGDRVDATFRYDGSGPMHGHTTQQSVFWNLVGLDPPLPDAGKPPALIHTLQWGWGAAIGTSGRNYAVSSSTGSDGTRADREADLVEGVAAGRTLVPASLWRDQRARRGIDPAGDSAEGAVLTPDSESTVVGIVPLPVQAEAVALGRGRSEHLVFGMAGQRRVTRARLVVNGRSRRGAARLSVYGVSLPVSPLSGDPLSTRTRSGVNGGAWVFDVTEHVQRAQSSGSSVRLRVAGPPDEIEAAIATGINADPAMRPRLELETVAEDSLPSESVVAAGGRNISSTLTDRSVAAMAAVGGDGAPVVIDLGIERAVSGVGVGFSRGDRRLAFGEIQVSRDGSEWEPVRQVVGGGETNAVQGFAFDAPRRARYVRLVGYGTGDPDAYFTNAYTELEVYGD